MAPQPGDGPLRGHDPAECCGSQLAGMRGSCSSATTPASPPRPGLTRSSTGGGTWTYRSASWARGHGEADGARSRPSRIPPVVWNRDRQRRVAAHGRDARHRRRRSPGGGLGRALQRPPRPGGSSRLRESHPLLEVCEAWYGEAETLESRWARRGGRSCMPARRTARWAGRSHRDGTRLRRGGGAGSPRHRADQQRCADGAGCASSRAGPSDRCQPRSRASIAGCSASASCAKPSTLAARLSRSTRDQSIGPCGGWGSYSIPSCTARARSSPATVAAS